MTTTRTTPYRRQEASLPTVTAGLPAQDLPAQGLHIEKGCPKQAPRNTKRPKRSHSSQNSEYAPLPIYNRIRVLMIHAPRYSFQGQARLAADAGVSRSTISRLLRGRINPSFRLAQTVTAALEKHLKRPLDPREVLSPDGTYPTPSGCQLAGCRGCMPDEAFDPEGRLKPDYQDLRPGDWSLSRASDGPASHRTASQRHPSLQKSANARKEAE